jgi:hypothetical protein
MVWQRRRVDFNHWANNYNLPLRMRLCQRVEQRQIDSLIDYAKESQARMWQRGLISSFGNTCERLTEMSRVYAAGKAIDIRMAVALILVNAGAAGKDQVGPTE